jgi:hypothetical protein
MKNFLKILPLICLCLACSNDIGESPNGQKTIGFGAKMENTRAVAELSDVEANGFSVWGGYSANEHLFDGRKVTYASGQWGYPNPEVWTFNNYNFHGVYPSMDAGVYTCTTTNNNLQLKITGFDTSSEVDLLHATALGLDGSTAPFVNLSFKHTLTNVSVQLTKHTDNTTDDIKVKQVYLLGLSTQGDYVWTKEGDNITATWKLTEGQTPTNIGQVFNESLETGTYKDFLTDMLLMPQPVHPENHPVVLLIVYDYAISGGETIENNILYTMLPENPVWDVNKKITYQATIHAQKDIIFATPIVEEWGSAQVGGTIIIK